MIIVIVGEGVVVGKYFSDIMLGAVVDTEVDKWLNCLLGTIEGADVSPVLGSSDGDSDG